MSSTPLFGPSGIANKPKPNSAASKGPRASEWTEARSSESSGEDDKQAARIRLPLSTPPTGNTGLGSGAAGARPHANALSYALATLSMDLPLIPMEQLPTWARRMPRKDPATLRHIPALLQHRIPAHANPTLTDAAAAYQPSHQLPPPRQDDAVIWFMAPSPPSGPGHHLPTLCMFKIPQDDRTTGKELELRCSELSHMARRVMRIQARGGPPRPAMRASDPTDRKLMEWILAADRLHKVMPDPTADTVWVSPLLLLRDTLYRAWVRLFMEIFVLSPPNGSGL